MDQNNDTRLERISDTLDLIRDDISDIKVDLAKHIYRTDIAEENLKILRNELKPVEKHVERMNGGLKLLSVILVVAAVVKVLIEFL